MQFAGFQPVPRYGPFSLSRPECMEVTVQGLTIRGAGAGPLRLHGIEGWGGGSATRGGFSEYPDADGGFPTEVTYSGRDITIEGSVRATDHHDLWRMREQIETLLTSPREDWLRVRDSHLNLDRQILVHRARPSQVTLRGPRYGIFTLSLRSATYPRLAVDESELVLRPGGSGRQENVGDYPANMSVLLNGPLTNPRLTWSSQFWWQFNGTIPSGETRVVDMTRRIIRNPAAGTRLDLAGTGTWPKVDPGYRTVAMSGTGSGSARLVWRSSWA